MQTDAETVAGLFLHDYNPRNETRRDSSPETRLAFLNDYLRVHANSISELTSKYEEPGQPRLLVPKGPLGLQSASLAAVSWKTGTLAYGEVRGGLINAGAVTGREFLVGLVVSGSVKVFLNGDMEKVSPGQAIVFLPGDECVQVFKNSGQFTLRIPTSSVAQFRLQSLPFRSKRLFRRILPSTTAEDILKLVAFMSEEASRLAKSSEGPSTHIEVLGQALVSRAAHLVEQLTGDLEPDSEMVRICIRCNETLWDNIAHHVSAGALADAACCSERQLYRAFDSVANSTPIEFALRTRLNFARSLLVANGSEEVSIAAIARTCGLGSAKRLVEAYGAEFGESPLETKERRSNLLKVLSLGP